MNAKLTAYALSELPPEERAALEAEMETNPALRAEAEEMRKFCAMLHDEVADADKTTLTSEQRFRVLREFSVDAQPQMKKPERSIWRHPAFWVPTAIAACTTAMLVINLKEQQSSPKEMEELVAQTKGRRSVEDVRVLIEKDAKPAVAGQTPAPGKPETPALVAASTPAARSGSGTSTLPPMPSPTVPESTVVLRRSALDGSAPSLLVAETTSPQGSLGETNANFSGVSELGRAPGSPDMAGRGVAIGNARTLDRFYFSPAKEGDVFMETAVPNLNGTLASVDDAPLVSGTAGVPSVVHPSGPALGVPFSPALTFGRETAPLRSTPPAVTGGDVFSDSLSFSTGGIPATRGENLSMGSFVLPDESAQVSEPAVAGREISGSVDGMIKSGAGTLALAGAPGSVPADGATPTVTYAGTSSTTSPSNDFAVIGIPAAPTSPAMPAQAITINGRVAGVNELSEKMLAESTRGTEVQATPAPAPSGGTVAISGGAKLQIAAGEPLMTEFDSALVPAAEPMARQPSPTSGPAPASRPVDALYLADSPPPAMAATAGGAPAAPAPSPAAGKPASAEAFPPGTSLGIFGAGVVPAAPATSPAAAPAMDPLATTLTPAPIIANPTPADATSLYAITDAEQDNFRRSITTTTTTTAESLQRREKQKEVEKLGKELRQIKDLQEAETRALRLVPRNTAGETYTPIYENPFLQVAQQPLSTFSIDVDTASYANVRRFLNNGQRPPADAVRLEELINYFPYNYEPPAEDGAPFSVTVDMAEAPWQPMHRLARIALKGREIRKERGAANFVFLVDVSGSMDSADKLPLVKQSLRMLTEQLKDTDRVAIVTYAGSSGVALTSTTGSERGKIQSAIEALDAGGSTNGAGGIRMAYQQAAQNFIPEGVNRVILCTDGDFNVGISSPEELEKLIAEKAKSRVFLSVLGYGTGNLKDRTMETLADKGNGNYAYIDSLSEARKVLVDQMNATLVTIAKDVKIQVEFNPAQVASYRLLGYENRALAKEDFNNDRKDAGEIGAGHTVTALYEIVPVGARGLSPDGRPAVDDLKYAPKAAPAIIVDTPAPGEPPSRETMTVKLRYKQPEGDKSQLIEVPVTDKEQTMANAPRDFAFAASVTGFGMMLRNSQHAGELTWDMVRDLALRGKGEDPLGYRGEFLQLIDKARGLTEGRE